MTKKKKSKPRKKTWEQKPDRIRILVVHGIGEQKRHESIEEIARNMMNGLLKKSGSNADVQIIRSNSNEHHSFNTSWRDTPIKIQWKTEHKKWVEVSFREVYWADLDRKPGLKSVHRFIWWMLSICGTRVYKSGNTKPGAIKYTQEHSPELYHSKTSESSKLNKLQRIKLALTSLFFFPLMIILLPLEKLLNIFNTRFPYYSYLYEYLGDIQLYQDWALREQQLEGYKKKTRVAIQKRMITALCQTASEYHDKKIQGYYIFAHSLGTMISYHALMEHQYCLPNYLNEDDFNNLHNNLLGRCKLHEVKKLNPIPERPPWVAPGKIINRKKLLEGMRGFLTVGSPINKIATIWPATAYYNLGDGFDKLIPWYNITDAQDIVGDEITTLGTKKDGYYEVGDFCLINRLQFNKCHPFTAHTSYWKIQDTTWCKRLSLCVMGLFSLCKTRIQAICSRKKTDKNNNKKTVPAINKSTLLMEHVINWIENYDHLQQAFNANQADYISLLKNENTPAKLANKTLWEKMKSLAKPFNKLVLSFWIICCFTIVYLLLAGIYTGFNPANLPTENWTTTFLSIAHLAASLFMIMLLIIISAGCLRSFFGFGEYRKKKFLTTNNFGGNTYYEGT